MESIVTRSNISCPALTRHMSNRVASDIVLTDSLMVYCHDKRALRKNRLGSYSKNTFVSEGYVAAIQCRNKSLPKKLLFCLRVHLLVGTW